MIYSDEFLDSLPTNTVEAGKLMCKYYYDFEGSLDINSNIDDYYFDFIDAFVAIQEFVFANNMLTEGARTKLTESRSENINIVRQFVKSISERLNNLEGLNVLESARIKYKTHFANSFSYKFTDGDLKRIQTLINNLRDSINESPLFEDNHKTRLLGRLENLQKELHKKMSNIDVIYGFMGDAGVVLGKFGENAKPFIDMINEIIKIAWRTQATAEELPSSSSMPTLNE